MSAVASNSGGRGVLVAGSLRCFGHEHREPASLPCAACGREARAVGRSLPVDSARREWRNRGE